ncbi:MAG: ATP-binding cassette domain-containing protein [Acidimicrobiales bacterium]
MNHGRGFAALYVVSRRRTNDPYLLKVVKPIRYAPDGRSGMGGVSLCVLPGEIVCITGPNGSGKSQLLRILAGSITPDEGRIDAAGQDLPCLVAMEAFDDLTEATGADWLSADDVRRFGVPTDRPIAGLSSGERQRLALSTAANSPARIILLDSPTAYLDSDAYDLLEQVVLDIVGSERAAIIATNDPEVLVRFDQATIYRLDGGQLTVVRPGY